MSCEFCEIVFEVPWTRARALAHIRSGRHCAKSNNKIEKNSHEPEHHHHHHRYPASQQNITFQMAQRRRTKASNNNRATKNESIQLHFRPNHFAFNSIEFGICIEIESRTANCKLQTPKMGRNVTRRARRPSAVNVKSEMWNERETATGEKAFVMTAITSEIDAISELNGPAFAGFASVPTHSESNGHVPCVLDHKWQSIVTENNFSILCSICSITFNVLLMRTGRWKCMRNVEKGKWCRRRWTLNARHHLLIIQLLPQLRLTCARGRAHLWHRMDSPLATAQCFNIIIFVFVSVSVLLPLLLPSSKDNQQR